MIRLFTPQPLAEGLIVPLSENQLHYLKNVMRQQEGGQIKLFNGQDGEWSAKLARLDKKAAEALIEQQTRPQAPAPQLGVIFSRVKRQAIEYLVEKCTELGADAFYPVVTTRSTNKREDNSRLTAIATEAAEQSERLTVPTIYDTQPLPQLLASWNPQQPILLCDETGQGTPMPQALSALPTPPRAILIGPEGGFSPQELVTLRGLAYLYPVTLGPRILKVDTAAITALSICMAQAGDWQLKPAFTTT